nr:rRNA-processing protein UTP23 homolog [Onthophagus taurus]
MKVKRYKKVSRYLSFYINSFNFRQPYQLLIDGTFCLAALNNQINIADNIPKYLNGELKLLTTQCAIIEMEKLGAKLQGALLILKQYSLHKCGHERHPISGAKCFLSMVGKNNEKHYIIATQDRELQSKLRSLPGVPLLYLHSKAPVLDPPSETSTKFANLSLTERYGVQKTEQGTLTEIKAYKEEVDVNKKPKKRKGPKGPNPLSCKKKKKKIGDINKECVKKDKNKLKKKIRISKHVRDELLKSSINNT